MSDLNIRLDKLVAMIESTGADTLELTGWDNRPGPVPGSSVSPATLRDADFLVIGHDSIRLTTQTDADIALYLLLGAMARTGATGLITFMPGMSIQSRSDGTFPVALPPEWTKWEPLWRDIQSWMLCTLSAHGQLALHQRIAGTQIRPTEKDTA